jgi:hypothetical protein
MVGAGGVNFGEDVAHLQQLLIAAGETVPGGADGRWGTGTAGALKRFQKKHAGRGVKEVPCLLPGDHALLVMAWKAGILIPMPGKGGMPGVQKLHDWFRGQGVKYNSGAEDGGGNRAIWGVHGDPRYAVQLTNRKFLAGPIEMDCTTYVNLMLSVYVTGHCHAAPYAASCSAFGGIGDNHCARDRYHLPLVERTVGTGASAKKVRHFETTAQISQALARDSGGLYALEVAHAGTGSVSHMVLYRNGLVYECTTHQTASACISRPIEKFGAHKAGKIFYMFGPSPMKL